MHGATETTGTCEMQLILMHTVLGALSNLSSFVLYSVETKKKYVNGFTYLVFI